MTNPFWEQQQKMYQDFVNSYFGKFPAFDAYQKAYAAMGDAMKQVPNPMASVMQGNVPNPWALFMPAGAEQNPWASFMATANNPWTAMMPDPQMFQPFWNVKIPGFDTFSKLYDFWKGMENPARFMKDYSDKYMDMMQEMAAGIMPEGAMAFVQKPRELMDTCVEFYKSIMQPWLEVDSALLERISQGDQAAYVDFFREINGKYEDSFGKMFNMMGLGLNREKYERQMRAMNLYYKVMFTTAELFAMIQNTMTASMKELLEQYRTMMEQGKQVTTFKEFYELWYHVNEEALTKLFDTDMFSKSFGALSDVSGKYIQAMNALYEEMLSALPIPTKSDMDSLYKTVYDLRKDMRDVKKSLKSLSAK